MLQANITPPANPSRDDRENPTTPSTAWKIMSPRWFIINTLLGGTEDMRDAGEDLLPRHHREFAEDYDERLRCAVLFNVFELTLDTLAGRPFSEPLKIDGAPPSFEGEDNSGWLFNVDLLGNSIDQFASLIFRDGLAKGFTHVMVDTPVREPDTIRTLADEREAGIRPYLVHIPPENVLAAKAIRINGEEVLTHIRILENDIVADGFAERLIERIRVFDLVDDFQDDGSFTTRVNVTVWRKEEKTKRNGKDKWVIEEQFLTDQDRIQIFTFYAQRAGFFESKPPLMDLAHLNVWHWQSSSDQQTTLKVARFPILAASGIDTDEAETTLGPRNVLEIDNPDGRYYYVEHSGAAIEAGQKSLEDLVMQMSMYGASMLRRRPDRETAAARTTDERTQLAPLQKMAMSFKDMLENALRAMANMSGETDSNITVGIHTDFGFDGGEVVDLQTLQVAYRDFALSKGGFVAEMKRRGVLAPDFDPEADEATLQEEIQKGIGAILANGKDLNNADEKGNDEGKKEGNDET